MKVDLAASEEELHVFRRQFLHCDLVIVDGSVDHVGFLLLQQDHAALDRVFDTEARDDARTFLADTMAAIGRLPFCGWIPPSVVHNCQYASGAIEWQGIVDLRVNNEHSRCFCKVESYTSRFQRDKEDFDIRVVHEILDGSLALGRAHTAVEHDRLESGAAKTPFHKLQHRCKLREDDGVVCLLRATELVEVRD